MTSELEALKTNEFLRRRKLRIQQVREQSKDIAKKIRQRAKVEKLRHIEDLDTKKAKEYLEHQEKLVKRLEVLYARSVKNVGSSHKNAEQVKLQEGASSDKSSEKIDLSKARGKEAAAELRRQKQEKLDEQKKLLDRKLLARESANEISREKSTVVGGKLLAKSSSSKVNLETVKNDAATGTEDISLVEGDSNKEKEGEVAMNTQWESKPPFEWQPTTSCSVPLTKDDHDGASGVRNTQSERRPKPNLFALSDEMPLSLRGSLSRVVEETANTKPSVTIVSEYIHNRDLRLREDANVKRKVASDDLQNIKQTILRTRASKHEVSAKQSDVEKQKPGRVDSGLSKKHSVKMYNHSTRDTQDVPCLDKKLVIRDTVSEEDAYSLARRESLAAQAAMEREQIRKAEDMRNKVAMSKQSIDKEYKDTMEFLKSLPKDSRPLKTAYMDGSRQQAKFERKQQMLQYEFKRIEKDCKRHPPKSPSKLSSADDQANRDFQYSWMPAPDGDSGLTIHRIENDAKNSKGSVRFANVDSCYEYRSRHKHTPPTKDTAGKKVVEAIYKEAESTDSSLSSDGSSVENNRERGSVTKKPKKQTKETSDSERIVIYKILESRLDRDKSKNANKIKKITRNLSSHDKEKIAKELRPDDNTLGNEAGAETLAEGSKVETRVSIDQITEGVYSNVNEKGDNMMTMDFLNEPRDGRESDAIQKPGCSCQTQPKINLGGDNRQSSEKSPNECKCASASKHKSGSTPVTSSGMSFKTANFKGPDKNQGCIQLLDDSGHEAGKFYIGATGFLKDDDYEVVIQLRKKDASKQDNKEHKGQDQSNVILEKQLIPNILDLKTGVDNIESLSSKNVKPSDDNQKPNVDREVCTSSEGFVIPKESVRLDPSTRPATSISTQTTLESPSRRPAFNHMSSSTSTAYLSPPEIILPPYLKHNQNVNSLNVNVKHDFNNKQHSGTESSAINMAEYDYCQETLESPDSQGQRTGLFMTRLMSLRHTHNHASAPPNTARSARSQNADAEHHEPKHARRRRTKCEHASSSAADPKKHDTGNVPRPHKCKKISSKRSTHKLASETPGKSKHKNVPRRVSHKANLKPLVKTYVDKLLSLNRAGIKAVDVLNQECSAVTTPGSSIVEVPLNIDDNNMKTAVNLVPKISLEQFKLALIDHFFEKKNSTPGAGMKTEYIPSKRKSSFVHFPRKKSVHKVKSFNASRNSFSLKTDDARSTEPTSSSSKDGSTKSESSKVTSVARKTRSRSIPSPRNSAINTLKSKSNSSEMVSYLKSEKQKSQRPDKNLPLPTTSKNTQATQPPTKEPKKSLPDLPPPKAKSLFESMTPMSTQTAQINNEADLMKIAEGKLENMEKIADLTEKCTMRLTNLAKVLDEVRKSKTTHRYSQVSDSKPDIRQDRDEPHDKLSDPVLNVISHDPKPDDDIVAHHEPKEKEVVSQVQTEIDAEDKKGEEIHFDDSETLLSNVEHQKHEESPAKAPEMSDTGTSYSLDYISFLANIPKPNKSKSSALRTDVPNLRSPSAASEVLHLKGRAKPPPALSRKSLKHAPKDVVPHELSTVVEVDSPLSTKLRNQPGNSGRQAVESYGDMPDVATSKDDNMAVLQTSTNKEEIKNRSNSLNTSKIQMMDLKEFNDIMLKPFMSIEEYAKQCNIAVLDERSKQDPLPRSDDVTAEDLSSLHSENSLPDVIAELLKRNIISEPFKFENVSNVNSTSASSESSLSMLALSNMRNVRKRASAAVDNKAETSDTLSISSNPDLENAFKQLGLGWASSTLKKTKERLALSSSSNTSSSSLTQFMKYKGAHGDAAAAATDTVSSAVSLPRDAEQQTSQSKSMTVKQFLNKELAKKITFTNKSQREQTEEEFVSLHESKVPENMKQSEAIERSGDSVRSGNARARTSTPVQIFRSITYHSSSGSTSNGLFSNVDDLSSVKGTSNSLRNSTSTDKEDLTIPNYSLQMKKTLSDSNSK